MRKATIKSPSGDIELPKIAYGTDYFGTSVPENDAFLLMDAYISLGGSLLDTSRMYAEWIPNGRGKSEEAIGKWMESRKNRASVKISTKGGYLSKLDRSPGWLAPERLQTQIEESLEALRTDYTDIYLIHHDEPARPVGEVMETLHGFVESGKARVIGCSNMTAARVREANLYAHEHKLTPFSVSQIQWSLAASTPELWNDSAIVCMNENELAFYRESGIPIMAYTSQAKGYFAQGAASGLSGLHEKANERFNIPENAPRLERVKKLAEERGYEPTAIALAWILCNPYPALALIGCKTVAQLEATMKAAEIILDAQDIEWLLNG